MQNYEDKHNFFISIIYFLPQFNTYTFIYISHVNKFHGNP